MRCLVLGSAAGGGVPQWNCACRICALVRAGDPRVLPRTQASIAVSCNSGEWIIVGASPDLRAQILANPELAPAAPRHSPIAAVVLLSADIDGIAGLLHLREQQAFRLFAPAPILRILHENGIFGVLDTTLVPRIAIGAEAAGILPDLSLRLLQMPGKTPLYQEAANATQPEPAPAYAAWLEAHGRTAIVAPACAAITDAVLASLAAADALFFDGTLYDDNEMIAAGIGHKTGTRMGHVAIAGPQGSLARLAGLRGRRIYFHLNNSNPVLLENSPEYRQVRAAGFEIAHDGMQVNV